LSQLLSKNHISQFSHQNVSALLLATLLTNGAINQTLRHFSPLSDNGLL